MVVIHANFCLFTLITIYISFSVYSNFYKAKICVTNQLYSKLTKIDAFEQKIRECHNPTLKENMEHFDLKVESLHGGTKI